jgi:hypothetical protein
MNTNSQKNCPEKEILEEVAAGLCPPERASQVLQHVSRCPECAPQLRRLVNVFSSEITATEEEALRRLETSRPETQRSLVREFTRDQQPVPVVPPPPPPFRWWAVFALAPSALAVAVIVVWFVIPIIQLTKAQRLVATAWSKKPTETRFPGVPYAPYAPAPVMQGSQQPALGVDPAWIKAESAIVDNLTSNDPRWLQLQARMLLLRDAPGDIDNAEQLLESARTRGMATPALEIDLANAYFEHEKKLHPANPNLQKTLDLLNKVLHEPRLGVEDRRVALFNLAFAYEKTNAWDLALQTWNEYLGLDSSGKWADEARRRRDRAKSRVPVSQQKDLASPESFLEKYFGDSLRPEELEPYQQTALTLWLPLALVDNTSSSRLAIIKLADELKKKTQIRG